MALDLVERHYDAASTGRRTMSWRKTSGDANAVLGPALSRLRDHANELVRNNPYAESAVNTICDHAVGTGITGKPKGGEKGALEAFEEWADSTDCDADGLNDFYGLQKLVWRTVVTSGEVLVRRRIRFLTDRIPLNFQLQVMEPDFLDTAKEVARTNSGGRIIQGVEFDGRGKRIGYWLYPEHPGSLVSGWAASQFVPAESVLHIFKPTRAGQVRAATWFAQILLRARDFDDMEDAVLMTQKITACLSVILSDPEGDAIPLGTALPGRTSTDPEIDMLSPGAILNVASGRKVDVVNPPSTSNYDAYAKSQLRAIATGIGVTYEDLTGDYANMPFSAARMSRLRHWARVNDWRWRTLIPRFCNPVWAWAMESAMVLGRVESMPRARWTAEPLPMIDPAAEGLAYQRLVRNSLMSLSEAIREMGYDPEEVLAEIAADNALLDKLGILSDSDPRKLTQAGQLQGSAASTPAPHDDDATADRVFELVLDHIQRQLPALGAVR